MKKIIGLTIVGVLLLAMVAGGTLAYFSDPEQSDSNTVTAGILDLTRGGTSGGTGAFWTTSVSNVKPADTGTDSILLANTAGTMSGELDVNLGNLTDAAGAVGEFAGGTELKDNLYVAIWLDRDNGGSWGANDVGLKNVANTTYTYVAGATGNTVDSATTTTIVDAALTEADDYWNGFKITITSGTYSGFVGVVTDFVAATDTLTITALPGAPAAAVTYDLSGPLYYAITGYDTLGKYDNVLTMTTGAPGNTWDFQVDWLIPATVNNTIQGDVETFDSIVFTLEQANAD